MAEPYRLTASLPGGGEPNAVLRVADGALIPFDLGNADYQEYLDWLEAGNMPDPVPEPVTT